MVSYTLDRVFERVEKAGIDPTVSAKKADARNWFRQNVSNVRITPSSVIRSDPKRLTDKPILGAMYLFEYDPKLKKVLPYYDRFPLVFPIGSGRTTGYAKQGDSFLGLNMHYLPPILRAKLMERLWNLSSTKKEITEQTRLKLSYSLLQQAASNGFYKPCVKRYIVEHIQTRFLYIHPEEWEMVMFLPLDRFIGARRNQVYKDSRNAI